MLELIVEMGTCGAATRDGHVFANEDTETPRLQRHGIGETPV